MRFTSHSPEQTKTIAAEFSQTLKGGELIFLQGDLGSGKTTFVQGLVSALGFDGVVRSPTFALMHVYPLKQGSIKQVVHLDLYRLKDHAELRAFGLEEYLHDPRIIVLVEWPENGFDEETLLPDQRIMFTLGSDDVREVNIP